MVYVFGSGPAGRCWGEWVTGSWVWALSGTWGNWVMCLCSGCGGVGGVGREWMGGLVQGLGG